jgi:isopenicillin-N N-acyltransferase-like protein
MMFIICQALGSVKENDEIRDGFRRKPTFPFADNKSPLRYAAFYNTLPTMAVKKIPLIHIGGTPREMGLAFGRARKESVLRMISNLKALLEKTYRRIRLTWPEAVLQAQKYLPFAQELTPRYVEELRAIAEGADVPFNDLMVLNCVEAITDDALHLMGCTTFAVTQERSADGRVLIGHNEDWQPHDEEDVLLIRAEPEGEPAFLAMTYGGLLPNIGFNAAGICQCCDSVYPSDARIGVPRIFVSRAVLGAGSITQAISAALAPQRAAGYNHVLVHESGEAYNIEVSARRFSMRYAQGGILAHTNHYLSRRMARLENDPRQLIGSRVRYFRVMRLLRRSQNHDRHSLQEILRDHVNSPHSICAHEAADEKPLDRQKTICSLIIDLIEKRMYVAWGTPCQNEYYPYGLKA